MKQFPTPLLVAALLAFGAARLAADTDANETFPSAISTVNPCNGEVVALTGENHLLVHTTEPTSGNFELYFDLSSNYVGTGLTTGVGYQGSEDIFNSFSLQNPFPLVFVLSNDVLLQSATGVDNFKLRVQLHITLNADGVPTASVDNVSTTCNG